MHVGAVFATFPELETTCLRLRPLRQADAVALFAVLSDPKVTQYYDDYPFTEFAQAEAQIDVWNEGFRVRRCIRWGIVRREDDRVIGSCGYYGFHGWHDRASIGYESDDTDGHFRPDSINRLGKHLDGHKRHN